MEPASSLAAGGAAAASSPGAGGIATGVAASFSAMPPLSPVSDWGVSWPRSDVGALLTGGAGDERGSEQRDQRKHLNLNVPHGNPGLPSGGQPAPRCDPSP